MMEQRREKEEKERSQRKEVEEKKGNRIKECRREVKKEKV